MSAPLAVFTQTLLELAALFLAPAHRAPGGRPPTGALLPRGMRLADDALTVMAVIQLVCPATDVAGRRVNVSRKDALDQALGLIYLRQRNRRHLGNQTVLHPCSSFFFTPLQNVKHTESTAAAKLLTGSQIPALPLLSGDLRRPGVGRTYTPSQAPPAGTNSTDPQQAPPAGRPVGWYFASSRPPPRSAGRRCTAQLPTTPC